jgi:hypothetical protein
VVVVRGRSIDALFGNLPAVSFSSIFPLTLSLRAVIASVNQIHSKEAIMGVLRDRMIEEMKLRNFPPATQASYVYAVSRLPWADLSNQRRFSNL